MVKHGDGLQYFVVSSFHIITAHTTPMTFAVASMRGRWAVAINSLIVDFETATSLQFQQMTIQPELQLNIVSLSMSINDYASVAMSISAAGRARAVQRRKLPDPWM